MKTRRSFSLEKLLYTLLTAAIVAVFSGITITRVTPESAIWAEDTWACRESDETLIYFDGSQANVATEVQARTARPDQVWCNKERSLLSVFFRKLYSALRTRTFASRPPVSPVELFKQVSPSIFVVEALDQNGKTLVLGSGVALGRDFLVTNCHVIQSGSSLRVSRGKENWTARLIQAAPNHDLCGLRPSGLTLHPVEVRPSSQLATGEHVYAIGSPEGLELTFSEGVISALRDAEGVHLIQTSAAISPGSSGGGLFDAQGNLVGITSFRLKEGQSLNFALPGEWVSEVLASTIEASKKSSPRLSDAELESRAWIEIGLEAVKKEEYDLAERSFRKCADLKQSDASRAWLELGYLGQWAKDLYWRSDAYRAWLRKFEWSPKEAQERAIAAFEKAIELKPDYAEAWLELARIRVGRGEYDQALPAAREATRLAPGDWQGWVILGGVHIKMESYTEAIDAFQRGEKVAPEKNKWTMLMLMGVAYAKKGDREQVMRVYRELKASDPKTAEYFFKEYVLRRPKEHRLKQMSKQDDGVLRVLRNAPTADDTRQAAWDAFHAALNEDDFKRRFDAIPLADTVKAELWELKFGSQTPTTGNPFHQN